MSLVTVPSFVKSNQFCLASEHALGVQIQVLFVTSKELTFRDCSKFQKDVLQQVKPCL